MFKSLRIAALTAAVVAVSAGSAMARGEPWAKKAPEMTQEQRASAAAAAAVRAKLPADGFGFDPLEVAWKKWRGVRRKVPVSNMTVAQISDLIKGKYRIIKQGTALEVVYYGPNGVGHLCEIVGKRGASYPVRYEVMPSAFGLAGLGGSLDMTKTKLTGRGWSLVGDNRTGLVYSYTYDKSGKVFWGRGWVQKELPAYVLTSCPDMPQTGKVNASQDTPDFDDLLANSKRVTSFQVAFPNNPQAPMTAGMFYHLYPPVQ